MVASIVDKVDKEGRDRFYRRDFANDDVSRPRETRDGAEAATRDAIYDEYRRGVEIKELARRFGRGLASIYRLIGTRRAKDVFALPLDFVPSAEFETVAASPEAENRLLSFYSGASVSTLVLSADSAALSTGISAANEATNGTTNGTTNGETENGSKSSANRKTPNGRTANRRGVGGADVYFARLDESALLTPDEERFLFRKYNYLKFKAAKLRDALDPERPRLAATGEIERLWAEAVATKRRIVSANLRLVVSIAKKYCGNCRVGFNDLVGDGNLSLAKAVEKFDYSTGNRFSTYATWAIYRNFSRSIPDEQKTLDRVRPIDCEILELTKDYRPNPTKAERVYREQTSQVAFLTSCLNDRERTIIELRYGLGKESEKPLTLRQVGEDMGVTKERVRQIELRALAKMRRAAEDERLEFPE